METLSSKYITIYYENEYSLKKFNSRVYVKGKIRDLIRKQKIDTIPDMVIAKVDSIIERVMEIIDLYPFSNLDFGITIFENAKEVSVKFKELYNVDVDYIAFYSRTSKMIYFSAKDSSLRVTSHEIGHGIAEMHFKPNSPSSRLHEVIAQYVETKIYD